MIVKILSSASRDFHGVKYNDKKVHNEKGELMLMKNFPSFINESSSQEEVRDYLKAISESERTRKPQFHAVISTKYQEHSKEQLTEIADNFMQEMGYGQQPYLVVFHKDTENNHVHIVSTRVDKNTGKKINDSFERLKSQQALAKAMRKVLGTNHQATIEKLLQYRFSNLQQLEMLLTRNGFKVVKSENNPNQLDILYNGVVQKTLFSDKLHYQEKQKGDKRIKQIEAFMDKYKELYSNKVFRVIDDRVQQGLYERNILPQDPISPQIEYASELQEKLRQIFGIDIVFHFRDDKQPFGYTVIDNKNQQIYKGSEIAKMKDIFDFTEDSINKKEFERLKDYNLRSGKEKQILIQYLLKEGVGVKDFMLFENKRFKGKESNPDFQQLKEDVRQHIHNTQDDDFVILEQDDNGAYYAIHERYHQIHKLSFLLDKEEYQAFIVETSIHNTSEMRSQTDLKHSPSGKISEVLNDVTDIFKALGKSTYTPRDTTEDELKKRRKKRK